MRHNDHQPADHHPRHADGAVRRVAVALVAATAASPQTGQPSGREVPENLDSTHPHTRQLVSRLLQVPSGDPNAWRQVIAQALPTAAEVVLTGTLERRLLAVQVPPAPPADDRGGWFLADCSGLPHVSRDWPSWARAGIRLQQPDHWFTRATLTPAATRRLTRPRILLAALYRREIFPLPRFSLSVCDLARAARATLSGHVSLLDMQLGTTLSEIRHAAASADIVGFSATFGQHDLLCDLLDAVFAQPAPPLVLAGGSLTARNERLLLRRYPALLVARGAGEPTITDTIAHWHGDLARHDIRGIGYTDSTAAPTARTARHTPTAVAPVTGTPRSGDPAPPSCSGPNPDHSEQDASCSTRQFSNASGPDHARPLPIVHTPGVTNRRQPDFLPELDLLDATLAAGGVAQLESSRGCTSACSFCPRGHKGSWAGADPSAFTAVLSGMAAVFDRHPDLARVLYLVDEEFIGAAPDAVPRARQLAETLHHAGYRWESSCRVDQVARPDADHAWHVERAKLWRHLLDHGLRRCLFGIESGVTSILERFNKETTSEQNIRAIRTLSALSVPTRYTYITFDHLMSLDELVTSHRFQGRTDLILRPLPHLPVEDIVRGVQDPDFVAAHATGEPFYRGISYMLVSMECLVGAAYTRRVQAAGLAGPERPSMGRIDAAFAHPGIGECSDLAQRWVDRHFTFDYTLKSLEKTLDGPARHAARSARAALKDAAHALLGDMVTALTGPPEPDLATSDAPPDTGPVGRRGEQPGSATDPTPHLRQKVLVAMQIRNQHLQDEVAASVPDLLRALPPTPAAVLRSEYARWRDTTGWQLINDAAPCT